MKQTKKRRIGDVVVREMVFLSGIKGTYIGDRLVQGTFKYNVDRLLKLEKEEAEKKNARVE